MAGPSECDKLAARVLELEAKVAELRAENVRLHELMAFRDHLSEILNAYADKGWNRLAVVDRERRQVDHLADVLVAALKRADAEELASTLIAIHHAASQQECHDPAAAPDAQRPPVSNQQDRKSMEEWFNAGRESARQMRKRGRPLSIPLDMVARWVVKGLRGNELMRKLCAEMGHFDESGAWRSIKAYKQFVEHGGWTFLLELDENGDLWVVSPLPPY